MRWAFRIFVTLGFIGLAILAVRPYLPELQREAQLFYETWQKLRSPESEPAETTTVSEVTQEATTAPARGRQLLTPEGNLETASTELSEETDPFILEARRRATEDPEAAMQWLQTQSSGSERLRGMLEVVALWAAEDSENALLWLESNAQGLARIETLNSGVELWAERNPVEAATWIEGMANDGSKITAAKALATKWVLSQPNEASSWVAALPNGPVREAAAQALTESWLESDPQAASVWTFSEAEFNGNDELLHETIREYSKLAPAEAEAFVRDMAEAGGDDTPLFSHIIGRAEQDPAATAEWLANMAVDDPIYSSEYANGLMQVWAQSDSIAASEWLSQQAPGAQRDAAVYGFSESIQEFEPEAAAAWANTIGDPERRLMRLEESVAAWARTQPVQALEWVKTADLEPDLRNALASEIPWD